MTARNDCYHSGAHSRYLTQYHVVWCPKFRYPVLQQDIAACIKQILREICERYHYEIKALEIMPDHIHIFVDCPHTVAPCDIARTLKSLSAIELFKDFPELKRFYGKCGRLWSDGYFISTVGQISETAVQRYIEEQNHGSKRSTRKDN